ncbi:hypothetical protein QE152_g26088 [Popillia japonica]|uniref:Uncharacterized protein n=1 Tax=Popillia japonica TaxID=7064 RepID=A0AAW1K0D3_POPJA
MPIHQSISVAMSHNQYPLHPQGLEWFDIDPHEPIDEVWQQCCCAINGPSSVSIICDVLTAGPEPNMPLKHTRTAHALSPNTC